MTHLLPRTLRLGLGHGHSPGNEEASWEPGLHCPMQGGTECPRHRLNVLSSRVPGRKGGKKGEREKKPSPGAPLSPGTNSLAGSLTQERGCDYLSLSNKEPGKALRISDSLRSNSCSIVWPH